jgi:hypothetical protein
MSLIATDYSAACLEFRVTQKTGDKAAARLQTGSSSHEQKIGAVRAQHVRGRRIACGLQFGGTQSPFTQADRNWDWNDFS